MTTSSSMPTRGSIAGLQAILGAERLKRERLDGLSAFVRDLQKSL